MLRSEFETLTRIYPSETLYSVIEEFYNESKLDKHEFCENYKLNADGLAERIQEEANELEAEKAQQAYFEVRELKADLDKMRMDRNRLKDQLDRELAWHPAEHTGTNMKQADYQKLLDCYTTEVLSDEEAVKRISELFGFMPDRIQILREVQTFEVNKYNRQRVKDTYQREPLYDATDWNYIRFDCAGNQWELVNGELLPYED
jgi:hypothetical protein